MSFLGASFLAGLLGILAPLAIHLFSKRKRVQMPWGAMRFLAEAKPNWRKRTLRLQDWLILLLRAAAVALLALAFARPLIQRPAPPETTRDVIIIADRSASTALGEGHSDGAISEEIDKTLERLFQEIPEDQRIRLFANGAGRDLLPLAFTTSRENDSSDQRRTLLAAWKRLPTGVENLPWPTAVRRALRHFSADQRDGLREIIVLGDAASGGWSEAPGQWQSAMTGDDTKLTLIPIAIDHPDRLLANLCISEISADRLRVVPGAEATLLATIANRGTADSSAASVLWFSGDQQIAGEQIPALEPGGNHLVTLQRAYPTAGPQALQVKIIPGNDSQKQALEGDNTAALVIDVVDRQKVLFVTDELLNRTRNEARRFSQWAFATAAAGGPSGADAESSSSSIFAVQEIRINAFAGTPLDDVALVVWSANDRDPDAVLQAATKLQHFANSGGGVWLMPSPDTNVELFNKAFFPHDFGLSPAALEIAESTAEEAAGLRPIADSESDPAPYRDGLNALSGLRATRHFRLLKPLPLSSRVVAEFEGGDAFLVRNGGRSNVALTTLNAHPSWSNIASTTGYLPFVRELLWQLSSGRLPQRNLVAGTSLPWTSLSDSDTIQLPDGNWVSPLDGLSPEQPALFSRPGLYLVESTAEEGRTHYSIAPQPRESVTGAPPSEYWEKLRSIENLNVIKAAEIDQIFPQEEKSPAGEDNTGTADPSGSGQPLMRDHEITAWLLIGLLGFLIIEVFAAHHLISRRRRAAGGTARS